MYLSNAWLLSGCAVGSVAPLRLCRGQRGSSSRPGVLSALAPPRPCRSRSPSLRTSALPSAVPGPVSTPASRVRGSLSSTLSPAFVVCGFFEDGPFGQTRDAGLFRGPGPEAGVGPSACLPVGLTELAQWLSRGEPSAGWAGPAARAEARGPRRGPGWWRGLSPESSG